MAVPETLCHPFATAKIVVWTRTRSVRGRPIAARRGDATLCACGRRSERTGNRCGRDKSSKCLLHSRPSCACMACGHAIAAPSTTLRNSRRCMSTPERAIVSGQLSAWIVAGFELLVADPRDIPSGSQDRKPADLIRSLRRRAPAESGHDDAERLCGVLIDHQREFARLLDREDRRAWHPSKSSRHQRRHGARRPKRVS